jgi:hypothetical protein
LHESHSYFCCVIGGGATSGDLFVAAADASRTAAKVFKSLFTVGSSEEKKY